MYIIGFIFIFIGLSLLLYTIIIFFTNQAQNKKIEDKISNQSTPKEKFDLKNDSPSVQSNIQVKQNQKNTDFEKETTIKNSINFTNKEIKSKDLLETQNQSLEKVKNMELLITGYLYYDNTGTTDLLLEKQEKTPSEILSNLIRLGNATLEWSINKFIFNFPENQILLNLKDLKEVRFIEDCAIFIPIQKKPYYYFFSKQIQELKNFLSNLTIKYS